MSKVLNSYYLKDSYGCVQLVEDEGVFLVGWNALQSVDDPNWGYSVHCFSTFEEAKAAFDKQYSIDKSWGRAI